MGPGLRRDDVSNFSIDLCARNPGVLSRSPQMA